MAGKNTDIAYLTRCRDAAQRQYFAHRDPGNLTPAQKTAHQHRNMALLLLLEAAQLELDAETEMQELLNMENAA